LVRGINAKVLQAGIIISGDRIEKLPPRAPTV
jgi:hypothetical protein